MYFRDSCSFVPLFVLQISLTVVFELSFCNDDNDNSRVWITVFAAYQLLLLIALLYLSYKNSRITNLRAHAEEGQAGTRMVVAVTVMTFVTVSTYNVLQVNLQMFYIAVYWLKVLYTTATPILFLAVIFVPKVRHCAVAIVWPRIHT